LHAKECARLSDPAPARSERNEQDDVLPWSPADARAVAARVVSMPCVEWFAEQDDSYQQEVLPTRVRARVSVEAGIALGWRGFVGDAGECVGLEHFGESADYQTLYREFGITAEHVVTAAKASLARVRAR
jgi:transketolase